MIWHCRQRRLLTRCNANVRIQRDFRRGMSESGVRTGGSLNDSDGDGCVRGCVLTGDARTLERAVSEVGDVRRDRHHLRLDQTRRPVVHRTHQRPQQPGLTSSSLLASHSRHSLLSQLVIKWWWAS